MWKSKVFYGVLFTVVGAYNSMFHYTMNVIAAIVMFLFAASSLNSAVEEYYKEKQNKEDNTNKRENDGC